MAWSVVLFHDGEPVTGVMPCDDYDAAGIVAPFFAGLSGGAVSVSGAVLAARPRPDEQVSLFEEVA